MHRGGGRLLALAALLSLAAGCSALSQVAALRDVRFSLDRISGSRLAGVDLSRLRSWDDLRPLDATRILSAVAEGHLPLELTLWVEAENPQQSASAARLLAFDWRLLLDRRETVTGSIAQEVMLRPGVPVDIPLPVQVDLLRFFDDNARDLFDLALAAAGREMPAHRLELRARPTIATPYGPLRYPDEITLSSTTP